MNEAFEIGAAALRAEQKALDILANNVANVGTPAFKRVDARFSEVLAREAQSTGDTLPVSRDGMIGGAGVRVSGQDRLFEQGELRSTDNPLDLAIDGRGLIELLGPRGTPLFWRGGSLRVNEDGLLATSDGLPLRAGIVVPDDAESLEIAANGIVSVTTTSDESIEIGQIDLVRVDHESAMQRLDNGLYQPASGVRLIDARPGEDGAGTLAQGRVEESNVSLTQEMVQILIVQRAFAASAQVVQAADQLAAITSNLKS